MINYTPQNQLSLDLFEHPFDQELDCENRWVILSGLIPWDSLASVYCSKLRSDSGRLTVDVRSVIAALIVKHKLGLDDRGTIEMIKENIYLQYFCGLKSFTIKAIFDPSLFVDIRKRLGGLEFEKFNRLVIAKSEEIKPKQARIKRKGSSGGPGKDDEGETVCSGTSKNKGTLKVDATVADQEISFPTDIKLLNACRENLEHFIDILYIKERDGKRPRLYRRVARRDFLNLSKKKNKSKKVIRKGIRQQLQYVRRDLGVLEDLLSKPGQTKILTRKDKTIIETINKIYEQQKWMFDNKKHSCEDRIVNLFQPHVRPIVRGKDKGKTEFGAKINVSEVNGFCRIDKFDWDAYNEGKWLKQQVENFYQVYKRYPKVLLADRIYLTRENRIYLKELGIEILGKPLGRPPKVPKDTPSQRYRKKKKEAERNHVEGKFGQGKRGYALNNIKARLPETSESWVNGIFFIMNVFKLLQVAEKYGAFLLQIKNQFRIAADKIFAKVFCHYHVILPN